MCGEGTSPRPLAVGTDGPRAMDTELERRCRPARRPSAAPAQTHGRTATLARGRTQHLAPFLPHPRTLGGSAPTQGDAPRAHPQPRWDGPRAYSAGATAPSGHRPGLHNAPAPTPSTWLPGRRGDTPTAGRASAGHTRPLSRPAPNLAARPHLETVTGGTRGGRACRGAPRAGRRRAQAGEGGAGSRAVRPPGAPGETEARPGAGRPENPRPFTSPQGTDGGRGSSGRRGA